MTSSLIIFIAGLITLGWPIIGFALLWRTIGEKVFSGARPIWLSLLCWAYITLALLAWTCFLKSHQPLDFVVVGILTLSAVKFIFFYISYEYWRRAFTYLWDRRIIFIIILGCGLIAGAFMLFISRVMS